MHRHACTILTLATLVALSSAPANAELVNDPPKSTVSATAAEESKPAPLDISLQSDWPANASKPSIQALGASTAEYAPSQIAVAVGVADSVESPASDFQRGLLILTALLLGVGMIASAIHQRKSKQFG